MTIMVAEYARLVAEQLGLHEHQVCAIYRAAGQAVPGTGHHERWDGTGYPHGLAGTAIPLPARIAAVADVFDALTAAYRDKQAWSLEDARRYVLEERGRHFDPACVDAFMARWDDVVAISGTCSLEMLAGVAPAVFQGGATLS